MPPQQGEALLDLFGQMDDLGTHAQLRRMIGDRRRRLARLAADGKGRGGRARAQ
jgi:hypothetical protein